MMVVLCVDVFLGVFSRYVLRSTFTWYDEIARLLFVWMVFLGAAVGVRQAGHFRLHLVIDRFPPSLRRRSPGRARHHAIRGRARAAGMEARGAGAVPADPCDGSLQALRLRLHARRWPPDHPLQPAASVARAVRAHRSSAPTLMVLLIAAAFLILLIL